MPAPIDLSPLLEPFAIRGLRLPNRFVMPGMQRQWCDNGVPLPRLAVEAKGAAWARPGAYVSDGPYALKEWVPNDHITLIRNARFYDAGNVRIAQVNYFPTSDPDAALRRFRAGELDLQTPAPMSQAIVLFA